MRECPQCPWMGNESDIYFNHDGVRCCPRCGVALNAPKTFIPLSNLVLFAFSLDKRQLYYGTAYEDEDNDR